MYFYIVPWLKEVTNLRFSSTISGTVRRTFVLFPHFSALYAFFPLPCRPVSTAPRQELAFLCLCYRHHLTAGIPFYTSLWFLEHLLTRSWGEWEQFGAKVVHWLEWYAHQCLFKSAYPGCLLYCYSFLSSQ